MQFCYQCGAPRDIPTCPNCHAEVQLGWRFCVDCGESLDAPSNQAEGSESRSDDLFVAIPATVEASHAGLCIEPPTGERGRTRRRRYERGTRMKRNTLCLNQRQSDTLDHWAKRFRVSDYMSVSLFVEAVGRLDPNTIPIEGYLDAGPFPVRRSYCVTIDEFKKIAAVSRGNAAMVLRCCLDHLMGVPQ